MTTRLTHEQILGLGFKLIDITEPNKVPYFYYTGKVGDVFLFIHGVINGKELGTILDLMISKFTVGAKNVAVSFVNTGFTFAVGAPLILVGGYRYPRMKNSVAAMFICTDLPTVVRLFRSATPLGSELDTSYTFGHYREAEQLMVLQHAIAIANGEIKIVEKSS